MYFISLILNIMESFQTHFKNPFAFHQVLPQCLRNVERIQKWKSVEKKETNQLQKHPFLCWERVEILRFSMPKHYRTATNRLILTVTIQLQNFCHYIISKHILHYYFFNSSIQLKTSPPFPWSFFLDSYFMQESYRERTPKSLFYQILTFTISNPLMQKLDVQAVRTKASLQCTYFEAITFIFQVTTTKNPNTFSIFYDSKFLFEVP